MESDFDFERDMVRWRAEADKKGKQWDIPLTPGLRDELKAFRVKFGGAFGGLLFPSPVDLATPLRRDVLDHWLLHSVLCREKRVRKRVDSPHYGR
jgi:integrase